MNTQSAGEVSSVMCRRRLEGTDHLVLDKAMGHLYHVLEGDSPLLRNLLETCTWEPCRNVFHWKWGDGEYEGQAPSNERAGLTGRHEIDKESTWGGGH